MFVLRRSHHNPILIPDRDHYWEGFATFNMCPIAQKKTIFGLFRAVSVPDALQTPQQVSIIGVGKSTDGLHFTNRTPFIVGEEPWDLFGCEDPRVTFFEGVYYTFYTALSKYPPDASSIKVGVALSKDLKKVSERHLTLYRELSNHG